MDLLDRVNIFNYFSYDQITKLLEDWKNNNFGRDQKTFVASRISDVQKDKKMDASNFCYNCFKNGHQDSSCDVEKNVTLLDMIMSSITYHKHQKSSGREVQNEAMDIDMATPRTAENIQKSSEQEAKRHAQKTQKTSHLNGFMRPEREPMNYVRKMPTYRLIHVSNLAVPIRRGSPKTIPLEPTSPTPSKVCSTGQNPNTEVASNFLSAFQNVQNSNPLTSSPIASLPPPVALNFVSWIPQREKTHKKFSRDDLRANFANFPRIPSKKTKSPIRDERHKENAYVRRENVSSRDQRMSPPNTNHGKTRVSKPYSNHKTTPYKTSRPASSPDSKKWTWHMLKTEINDILKLEPRGLLFRAIKDCWMSVHSKSLDDVAREIFKTSNVNLEEFIRTYFHDVITYDHTNGLFKSVDAVESPKSAPTSTQTLERSPNSNVPAQNTPESPSSPQKSNDSDQESMDCSGNESQIKTEPEAPSYFDELTESNKWSMKKLKEGLYPLIAAHVDGCCISRLKRDWEECYPKPLNSIIEEIFGAKIDLLEIITNHFCDVFTYDDEKRIFKAIPDQAIQEIKDQMVRVKRIVERNEERKAKYDKNAIPKWQSMQW